MTAVTAPDPKHSPIWIALELLGCQHWSERIQAAAALHQQSPGAAALTGNRPIIRSVTGTGPTQKDGNLQNEERRWPEGSSVLRMERERAVVSMNTIECIGGNYVVL